MKKRKMSKREVMIAKVMGQMEAMGCCTYLPKGETDADFAAEFNGEIHRIKVKVSKNDKHGVVRFDMNSSARHHGCTEKPDVDYFCLYSVDRNQIYLVKADAAPKTDLTVRYTRTDNHSSRIRYEKDVKAETVIAH